MRRATLPTTNQFWITILEASNYPGRGDAYGRGEMKAKVMTGIIGQQEGCVRIENDADGQKNKPNCRPLWASIRQPARKQRVQHTAVESADVVVKEEELGWR